VVGEGSSGKSEAEFILSGVDGRLLLEKMGLPPEEAASWLLSVEKERAKANLTRHQGICKQCGEIFKMGLAGHSVEGYCSPGCRKRGFKSTAAAVSNTAAEPVVAQAIDCPHCGRAIKAKPGGRCIYCGKAVLI